MSWEERSEKYINWIPGTVNIHKVCRGCSLLLAYIATTTAVTCLLFHGLIQEGNETNEITTLPCLKMYIFFAKPR